MSALLCISTISTFSIFLAIPLIGLFADDHYGLRASQIGFLSAIWPATVFCLSFLTGILADQVGYLQLIRAGLAINAFAFLCVSQSHEVPYFALSLFLFGIGKSCFDSSIRAAMASVCEPSKLEHFFRIRYLWQNVAIVAGPLIGIFAYRLLSSNAFILASFGYVFALLFSYLSLQAQDFRSSRHGEWIPWHERVEVFKSRKLALFVASGTLILMSYGAYEALMPVVVTRSAGMRPDFALLVSLNAFVVVIAQLGHVRWMKRMTSRTSIWIGYGFLILGFLCYGVEWNSYVITLAATVLFSIGEAVLFPSFEVLLTGAAPDGQRGAYFGAAELKQAGFFIGPALGGLALENGGTYALFGGCAISLALASLFTRMMLGPNHGSRESG
jgi:MFS family permease